MPPSFCDSLFVREMQYTMEKQKQMKQQNADVGCVYGKLKTKVKEKDGSPKENK